MPHAIINHAARMHGLPAISARETHHIAWEYTGWPCFFSEALSFEKQVLKFMREWKATGKWPRHPLDGEGDV
jgi:hypothetical protein